MTPWATKIAACKENHACKPGGIIKERCLAKTYSNALARWQRTVIDSTWRSPIEQLLIRLAFAAFPDIVTFLAFVTFVAIMIFLTTMPFLAFVHSVHECMFSCAAKNLVSSGTLHRRAAISPFSLNTRTVGVEYISNREA